MSNMNRCASILLSAVAVASAFLQTTTTRPSSASHLFGISAWREHGLLENEKVPNAIHHKPLRKVPMLTVPASEVALPGDVRYYQWNSDEEIELFRKTMAGHAVFSLGLAGDDVFYDKVVLMQVEHWVGDEELGVFVQAQAVGTASLWQRREDDTILCTEWNDRKEDYVSLQQANELVSHVEGLIRQVSMCEEEDPFFPPGSILNFEDDYDETETRWDRYKLAYQQALKVIENQGFISQTEASSTTLRSWCQVSAASWAAFGTSLCLKEDEPYRLAALDNDAMTNRLKFAQFWLTDVLKEAQDEVLSHLE